jgi:tRNA threonylcarbamoyladenosine biosynthesis protein TsaE
MEYEISLPGLDAFAATFWKEVEGASVFAFHGPMGAGKTTLITALCRHRGVPGGMSSPTFSIINQYAFEQNGRTGTIYHIDLYRLKDAAEIEGAGVEDCVYSGDPCFVEWPERAPHLFEEGAVKVYVEPLSEGLRRVKIIKAGR